jgi:hypothetical protein
MRRSLARRANGRPSSGLRLGLGAGTLSDCVGNTKTSPGHRPLGGMYARSLDTMLCINIQWDARLRAVDAHDGRNAGRGI